MRRKLPTTNKQREVPKDMGKEVKAKEAKRARDNGKAHMPGIPHTANNASTKGTRGKVKASME